MLKNIEFCSYWGMSVPQLVLSKLDENSYVKALNLINNSTDRFRVANIKREIEVFKYVMENIVVFDYSDPKAKRYNRELNSSKVFSNEDRILRESYLEMNKKSVQEYVKIGGDIHHLKPNTLSILKILHKKYKIVNRYDECTVPLVIKEQKFGGISFEYYLLQRGYSTLERDYIASVYNKTSNINQERNVKNNYRNDIKNIIYMLKSYDTVRNYTTLKVSKGKVINSNLSLEPVDEEIICLLDKYDCLKHLTTNEVITICNIGKTAKRFNVEYYNSLFLLELNEEEYIECFRELDSIGIVGLNFISYNLFKDNLKNYGIYPNIEGEGCVSAQLLESINRISRDLNSRKQQGEDLDEIYLSLYSKK